VKFECIFLVVNKTLLHFGHDTFHSHTEAYTLCFAIGKIAFTQAISLGYSYSFPP